MGDDVGDQDQGYNMQSSTSSSSPVHPSASSSWFSQPSASASLDYYSASTPWVVKKEANTDGY